MEYNTKNFTWKEFMHTDVIGVNNEPKSESVIKNCQNTIKELQIIRDNFSNWVGIEQPIIINSGYRSLEVNTAVGGAQNSYHMKGMSADIRLVNSNLMREFTKWLYYNIPARNLIELIASKYNYKWIHITYRL